MQNAEIGISEDDGYHLEKPKIVAFGMSVVTVCRIRFPAYAGFAKTRQSKKSRRFLRTEFDTLPGKRHHNKRT